MIASLSLAEMLCRMFVSFLARRSDDCAQFLEVALFHAQKCFACTSVFLQKFLQQRLVGTEQSAPKPRLRLSSHAHGMDMVGPTTACFLACVSLLLLQPLLLQVLFRHLTPSSL